MKDPNSPPNQLEIEFQEPTSRFLKIDEIPLNSFWVATDMPGSKGYTSAIQVIDTETYREGDDVVVVRFYESGLDDPPYCIDAFKLQYRYLHLPEANYPKWIQDL